MDEVSYPLDGVLDLHMFSPKEAVSVTEEYLRACHSNGVYEIRIIHGKGRGHLRRMVHSVLSGHDLVEAFGLDPGPSGWGATRVHLRRPGKGRV